MSTLRRIHRLFNRKVTLLASLVLLLSAERGYACDSNLSNPYGPYDYRTDKPKLKVVEDYHLTRDVEMLQTGQSTKYIGAELDYVLRAFPNHHKALRLIEMLARREKSEKPLGARWAVDCYFERAILWRKDDAMVRMLYGTHLIARNRKDDGIAQLRYAESLGVKSANLHYNLGLAYFDLGKHDAALQHAKKAYDMGFPLPGLKDKLKRAGKWK
jgi:tetratricopeptide (TPR) repeat protein